MLRCLNANLNFKYKCAKIEGNHSKCRPTFKIQKLKVLVSIKGVTNHLKFSPKFKWHLKIYSWQGNNI